MRENRGRICVPWGPGGRLDLEWPGGWAEPGVVEPDLGGEIGDYGEAVRRALDGPIGGRRLEEGLGRGSRVAIVVDDPSRWTPVEEALPEVLGRIHGAGVREEDVTISVGVGRHHAVGAEEMAKRVGREVAGRYQCFSPPVDDLSAYADLGETAAGIPSRVFRPVVEADLRVLVGSVLPHLQAGFGGGYKLIVPGCAHRSTLGAVHRRGLGHGDAGRLLGSDPRQNPMRGAIRGVVEKLGPCVSVSHALGPPGKVFRVESGPPDDVQDVLAAEVARRFKAAESPQADAAVAGNFPWPGDPMQSFKVLLNHRESVRPGGALVGLFWTDPEEIDRSFPMGMLRGIGATGVAGAFVMRRGLSTADRVASTLGLASSFMIRWAKELVVERDVYVYAPALRERVGPRLGPVRLYAELPELWADLGSRMGGRAPVARLFPHGGLTYVPKSGG